MWGALLLYPKRPGTVTMIRSAHCNSDTGAIADCLILAVSMWKVGIFIPKLDLKP